MRETILNKKIIQRSFSKAATTYDASSNLQIDVAEGLLKIFANITCSPPNSESAFALDIGCGTGTLAYSFKKKYPETALFACDFSLPMIVKAKERSEQNGISFLTSDCESLPFKNSFFICVTSSLTYQWIPDISSAFEEAWRVLKPGGIFIFSIPGPGTLAELRESYKKAETITGKKGFLTFMRFHDVENVSLNLKKAGFETITMEKVIKKKCYSSLWDLLKTLRATGASPPFPNGKRNLARGFVLKETAKTYQKLFPADNGPGIVASYDIVFVAARKR